MTARAETIRNLLQKALEPTVLEIFDDSSSHAGHPGASQSGGGHFYATIVSGAFEGKTLVQRHQLVYAALGDLMRTDIHALSIKAFAPLEYKPQPNQD
jgi:BolA protein